MDVSCPQCGNPKLDVDAQNSIVYCSKCGFAVRVDPQTGNVTPISEGSAGPAPVQQAYPSGGGNKSILGMDPLTFFLLFSAILVFLMFANIFGLEYVFIGEIVLFLVYWYNH